MTAMPIGVQATTSERRRSDRLLSIAADRTLARRVAAGRASFSKGESYVYRQAVSSLDYGAPSFGQAMSRTETEESSARSPHSERRSLGQDCQGLRLIFCHQLNVLLVCVPLGIASSWLEWSSAWRFGLNFAAIVPLAGILGAATENLALHTGQILGGLLNATFGNAVEMIVTVQAITANELNVVQGSLLGSILSNLLLVLGMSFFAAGLYSEEQVFNAMGASASSSCLLLGAIGLALPTIYNHWPGPSAEDVLMISRASSLVVMCIYLLFLIFQLKTHAHLFDGDEAEDDDEEEDEPELSACSALVLLLLVTCTIALNSEYLVQSIEGMTSTYGVPKAFIGVILLPIVGNAAEHTTAVTVAMKGKMDLSISVAVGSSTQVAVFVVPFAVLVGWLVDKPLTLDFRIFDATVLLMSVFLVSSVLHDGCSNWLEGAMLVATYILIAMICWYIPEVGEGGSEG